MSKTKAREAGASGGASDTLALSRIMAYAAPALPISALGLPLIVHLPPFYVGMIGLEVGLVGLVFMVVRLWDVITDPLMGWAADRFETRWGRRRVWILASVPILMLSSWMIFMPPPQIGWTYLLVWMLVLYVGWTMLTISHLSWGAELSANYHQRSRVQGVREAFLILGMVLALSLPIIIEYLGQNGDPQTTRLSIGAMGWFIILMLPVTVLIAITQVGERSSRPSSTAISWRESFAALRGNTALRYLLVTDVALGVSLGIVSSMFLFLVEDVLHLESWVANMMLLCYLITGICFVPLFVFLAKRIGKHYAQLVSAAISFITLPIILFVPTGDVAFVLVAWMVLGVNMAAAPILLRSMTADVSDADQLQSGAQRMALFYAMLTMTTKAGQALAIGLVYPLIDAIDFTRRGDNSDDVLWQMRLIYVLLPMLMNLIAMVMMLLYPIDRKTQEENRRRLEAR